MQGYYKTFNNCREQGLMLTIYEPTTDNELLIWACESRNSDNIMVITADRSCSDINDMFNNPQKRAMLEEGIKLLNEINNNQKEILKELKEINEKLNENKKATS